MTDDLAQRVLSGERRALARAMTLVENETAAGRETLRALYPHTGRAHTIGVTGAGGAGKSTLTNALAKEYRRRGRTVGIVAVDPSSPFTRGAILGDRIRMQELTGDPGIFMRSMATRGSLGGLSATAADAVAVLDAFGKDIVLLETVGAGQDEVEVASAAQTTLVINTPGTGDDVQTLKAGIMEIADLFVVNKADQPGTNRLKREIRSMLQIARQNARHYHGHGKPREGAEAEWRIPVLETIASEGEGVDGVMEEVDRHAEYLRSSGLLEKRRRRRASFEISAILHEELRRSLEGREDAFVGEILSGNLTPAQAVARLLER